MFARITWGDLAPDRLDDVATTLRPAIDSIARLDGYQGIAVLANRATGAAAIVAYWDTAQAMQASESAASTARTMVQGGPVLEVKEVDRFEFVLQDRLAPPMANTFVRVTDARAAPEKLDDMVAFVRGQVMPMMKTQSGFRAASVLVNRESGRFLAATVWNTAADREASEAAVAPLREEGREIGAAPSTSVERYEAILVEIKQAATV